MKKKYLVLISVSVMVLLVILVGIRKRIRTTTPPVSYESEIFEIVADVPVIVKEKEDDNYRLQYKLSIDNKSNQTINSLSISAEINPELNPYLISGNTVIPLGEYELVTKETAELTPDKAYGVECSFELLLRTEDDLATEGVTYQDVLKLDDKITVHLEWAGGSESVCAKKISGYEPTDAALTAMYAAEALNTWGVENHAVLWGGAYRDGEQCVVLLTEDNERIRKEVIERFTFNDIYVFRKCAFSLNYLRSICDKIFETEFAAYLSYNVSVRDNCVVVGLVKTDEAMTDAIERLDTAGNGEAIKFHIINLSIY